MPVPAGALGGEAGHRVLGDDVLDAQRPQATTQVLEVGDTQAAVLSQDRDLGLGELLGKRIDFLVLFGSGAYAALGHRRSFRGMRQKTLDQTGPRA